VDFEPISNERAALMDIHTQYAKPLVYGYVEDVEAGYALLLQKADEAGLQIVLEEIKRQLADFVASQ
jgi:putative aldouronate transport system substrate-binding protein